MLLDLDTSLSVQVNEYPGEFAVRFEVFKKHKETGLFLEHDGGKVCLGSRVLPREEDDEPVANTGKRSTFVLSPPVGARTWYRATTLRNEIYLKYAMSWTIVLCSFDESGWYASVHSPGNPFPITFTFENGSST